MENKTKSGFSVINVVEIPEECISKRVYNAMLGLIAYIDTSENLNEMIFNGNVFEEISNEQKKLPKNSNLRLSEEELKEVDSLAEEMKPYELIRINKN